MQLEEDQKFGMLDKNNKGKTMSVEELESFHFCFYHSTSHVCLDNEPLKQKITVDMWPWSKTPAGKTEAMTGRWEIMDHLPV